ncbi:MAG TPA: GNAT family N-acetyltransferase [Hymenobacter sp.]|jgi:GNAT superfamily N-acetyltransferase|uniref:GNAT family N-acetyltransferase n=1 Tax=Hymenobacter sp. TaxID=1898978 RepID=UPI002EDA781E
MTFSFHNNQPEQFLGIVREVAQWLVDRGEPLWNPDTLTADNLFDEHTRDHAYVLYVQPEGPEAATSYVATRAEPVPTAVPAATFTLQWQDPLYFGDVPAHTAGFIHKVAIRRAFAGQNLFQPLLDFCQAECRRRGIRELQLETDATRPALMRLYERYGFEPTYQKTIHEFGQSFLCQYYVLRF